MDPKWMPRQRVFPLSPDPNAGAEISITPRNASGWLIRTLRFQLVTDANVATRGVTLSATDGSNEWFRSAAGISQAASLTRVYAALDGGVHTAAVGSVIEIGLPVNGLWLPQGHTLRTITENIQATDQFSAVCMFVIEFPAGQGFEQWPAVPIFSEEVG